MLLLARVHNHLLKTHRPEHTHFTPKKSNKNHLLAWSLCPPPGVWLSISKRVSGTFWVSGISSVDYLVWCLGLYLDTVQYMCSLGWGWNLRRVFRFLYWGETGVCVCVIVDDNILPPSESVARVMNIGCSWRRVWQCRQMDDDLTLQRRLYKFIPLRLISPHVISNKVMWVIMMWLCKCLGSCFFPSGEYIVWC